MMNFIYKEGMGNDEIDLLFRCRFNHSYFQSMNSNMFSKRFVLLTFDRSHHTSNKMLLHKEEDKCSW